MQMQNVEHALLKILFRSSCFHSWYLVYCLLLQTQNNLANEFDTILCEFSYLKDDD